MQPEHRYRRGRRSMRDCATRCFTLNLAADHNVPVWQIELSSGKGFVEIGLGAATHRAEALISDLSARGGLHCRGWRTRSASSAGGDDGRPVPSQRVKHEWLSSKQQGESRPYSNFTFDSHCYPAPWCSCGVSLTYVCSCMLKVSSIQGLSDSHNQGLHRHRCFLFCCSRGVILVI